MIFLPAILLPKRRRAPRRPTTAEYVMNILVTGGAGYIGSCTSKALAHAGHNVTAIS